MNLSYQPPEPEPKRAVKRTRKQREQKPKVYCVNCGLVHEESSKVNGRWYCPACGRDPIDGGYVVEPSESYRRAQESNTGEPAGKETR
jgi:ribosomal protein L37AE/L43A